MRSLRESEAWYKLSKDERVAALRALMVANPGATDEEIRQMVPGLSYNMLLAARASLETASAA